MDGKPVNHETIRSNNVFFGTFMLVFFTGYLLFINDCYSDFTKRKRTEFVASDTLEAVSNIDDFLIQKDNIVGKVNHKIGFIGYPTVWLSER